MDNPVRTAACQCGALTARCEGEPVRASVCHCLDCQRRSGSVFAAQARFPNERVSLTGERRRFERIGDSGSTLSLDFCPICGSAIAYTLDTQPGLIAIPLGAFADPDFPPPTYSVYEGRRHAWVTVSGKEIEHYD